MAKAKFFVPWGSGRIALELLKLRGSFRLFLWVQLLKKKNWNDLDDGLPLSNVCHIKLNSSLSWQYCSLWASDLTQSIVRFLFIVLSNTMWKQSLFLITPTCDKPKPQHQQNVAYNHRSETVKLSCLFLINHFDHNYSYCTLLYWVGCWHDTLQKVFLSIDI